MPSSQYLGGSALRALTRIGDIICPENGDFPAYSRTGCIEHVDKMIAYVPAGDLKDLNMVLTILAFMPGFVLRWLVRKMAGSHGKEGGLSSIFRQLDFGLKGIILGTYYSGYVGTGYRGNKPLDVIGFELKRMES